MADHITRIFTLPETSPHAKEDSVWLGSRRPDSGMAYEFKKGKFTFVGTAVDAASMAAYLFNNYEATYEDVQPGKASNAAKTQNVSGQKASPSDSDTAAGDSPVKGETKGPGGK